MAATQQYSHTGEGGSTPQSRATAAGYAGTVYENMQFGTDLTAEGAVYWWQQDSIHLTTMLLPQHVHIGVGYATGSGMYIFVLMVGKPSKTVPVTKSTAEIATKSTAALTSLTPEKTATEPPIVVPILINTPGQDGSLIHIVQQGQTAWAIAARYGINLAELQRLNNLRSGALLRPGDRIIIRLGQGQAPPATPTQPTTHLVQPGETLWTIAARYGLTLDELLALNHLTRGAIVRPNDVIRLVAPAPTVLPSQVPTQTAPVPTPTPFVTATIVVLLPTATTAIPIFLPTQTPKPTALPPAAVNQNDEQSPLAALVIAGGLLVGVGLIAAGFVMLKRERL
jgi:LysM repeat protein